MAILVINSSPAVNKRTGKTFSQTEETFTCLFSKGNSTEFSLEKVQTRENGMMLKLAVTPSLRPSTPCVAHLYPFISCYRGPQSTWTG